MRANDPIWLHLAALAKVRPPHCFHLHAYMKATKGKFSVGGYATFAGLEIHHVERILAVFAEQGIASIDPITSGAPDTRGTRLPAVFEVPAGWIKWAVDDRNWSEADTQAELAIFTDYWHAQPGQRGVKLDWLATWRNWCRNSRRPVGTPPSTHASPLSDPLAYKRFCQEQLERETARGNRPGILNWRRKLETL